MIADQLSLFEEDDIEMIKTYVPEAEFMSFEDARDLAYERDMDVAFELIYDIVDSWRHDGEES